MNNNIFNKLNYIIVDYIKTKKDRKYRILKKNRKLLKNIILPPEIKEINKNININNFEEKYRSYVEEFVKVLKDNYDDEILNNFYQNMDTLKIKEKTNNNSIEGKYYHDKNTVIIYNNKINPTIFHELFHMASANNNSKKRNFKGFHQYSFSLNDFDLGKGLNEGYTELLTRKYFGNEDRYGYDFEVFIASYIESIIGSNRMSKFYFKADLKGLIKELSNYESENNIVIFLKCLDFYNKHCFEKNVRSIICSCVDFCIEFIFTSYLNCLRKMYDSNLINYDELVDSINQIYDDLCFKLFDNEEAFKLNLDFFVENVEQIFKDILDIKEVII